MTPASLEMLGNLRNPANLQWYVVVIITLILYVYTTELEKKRTGLVFLGVYFFATSGVILEIVNALILHFTGYSALWTTPGRSAFVIYAGWNVEILFLAAIGGLSVLKGLPERTAKIFRLPNVCLMIVWWAAPYYLLLWLHDHLSLRAKGILAGSSVAAAAAAHLVFATALGWV